MNSVYRGTAKEFSRLAYYESEGFDLGDDNIELLNRDYQSG